MDEDFDEPEPDFELTDSQENAYDEDLGTRGTHRCALPSLGFLDETREKERVIRGRLQPHEYKVLQLSEVMDSQKKLIARANDVLSGVPPGQMRILLRKFRWNVESLLETFAEKGEKVCTRVFVGAHL